ncbi:NUDIX domain-containing protein [Marinomonas agarivorans]|nr:NUDIX domain-containing protein [Marinomonas agarivorans]
MKQKFSKQDVKFTKEEVLYDGFFTMKRFTFEHKLFAGGWSKPVAREVMVRGDAVCVLLYDPKVDKVLLIEQFRVGAIKHDSPWLLEVVAGMVEEGENDEDVARREALEEAGVQVGRLEYMFQFLPSPGGLIEYLRMYAGEFDASQVNLNNHFGLAEENEDIRLHLMTAQEAIGLLETEIDNASAIMALQWLALNKAKLREKWGY